METDPGYKRILLKLSGEALLGGEDYGIDPVIIHRVATEIAEVARLGVEMAIVIGAGNIFRGAGLAQSGIDRVTGDHMGMLATIMNCLALQDALESLGCDTRLMTAIRMDGVAEAYIRRRALRHLEKGRVVIFAAGTSNPYFSTDTVAAQRALEIGCDMLLMAKNGVDGVYEADPRTHPDARMFACLDYDEVLRRSLTVADASAFSLCRDNLLPIVVFNMSVAGTIGRVVRGESVGTLVADNVPTLYA